MMNKGNSEDKKHMKSLQHLSLQHVSFEHKDHNQMSVVQWELDNP